MEPYLPEHKEVSDFLLMHGVTVAEVVAYGRNKFPSKSYIFSRSATSKNTVITDTCASALNDKSSSFVCGVYMAMSASIAVVASTSSSVVKQALAFNATIEVVDKSDIEPKLYRGPQIPIDAEKHLIITREDEKTVIPVHHFSANTNSVKIEGKEQTILHDQGVADMVYVLTHLCVYQNNTFNLKSGWDENERKRFGFPKVFSPDYLFYLTSATDVIQQMIEDSTLKKNFLNKYICGPTLAENLEALLSLSREMSDEQRKRRLAVFNYFKKMFRVLTAKVDVDVTEDGENKKKTVAKNFVVVANREYTTAVGKKFEQPYYDMPLVHKKLMFPTIVGDCKFVLKDKSASYDQALSELKASRDKCGTNISSETTPGTREMLLGVKTGTGLIDIVNLISDLKLVKWASHPDVVLEPSDRTHAVICLRAMGNAVANRITVYVLKKFSDPILLVKTETGFQLSCNELVTVQLIDSLDEAPLDAMHFVYAPDIENGGNSKDSNAVKQKGVDAVVALMKRKSAFMARSSYYPGLFAKTGTDSAGRKMFVFNSAAMHNMVVWVTRGVDVDTETLKSTRYSLEVEEKRYYYAIVVYCIFRQLTPFFQRPVDVPLRSFGVKVPNLTCKVIGQKYVGAEVDDVLDALGSGDYVRYTSLEYVAEILERQQNLSDNSLDFAEGLGEEKDAALVDGDGLGDGQPNVPKDDDEFKESNDDSFLDSL